MRILFFNFLLISSLSSLAQITPETTPKVSIGERGLNRFFFDGSLGFGWDTRVSGGKKDPYHEHAYLTDFRIGNNFYLGKGQKPMILRLTYFRTGLIWSDGLYLYGVLPSLGLGKHFNLRNTNHMSLEPMVHFGVVTTLELFSDGFDYYNYYFSSELKLNMDLFTVGLEFTTRKIFEPESFSSNNFTRGTYIGLSLGRRFGKNLRFSD